VISKTLVAQGVPAAQIPAKVDHWASVSLFVLQIGAFSGMLTFTWIAQRFGDDLRWRCIHHRVAEHGGHFPLSGGDQGFLDDFVMGFFQLSPFAIYAIYLPELFPTSLRSTGTSFCYNVGRFVAAMARYFWAS